MVEHRRPAGDPSQAPLTDRQGHPVYDNQNMRTLGSRGPATLENYQFLEKMSHFDRERVPERVVHARGTTAYGYFESYGAWGDEPIAAFTRAKLFQQTGQRTDVAIRFSTVAGGRDSSEMARDPRGFAIKFYTEDGNWDLVGNNLGIFFIRDAIKFPDFIHTQKPDPATNEASVPNRAFDFFSQSPESLHMVTVLFSPRGIPASYRQMQGFGVNTYKWVNAEGQTTLVKYHWIPKLGVSSLTQEDADTIQAKELGYHTKDLYDAITRGDYPEWELQVQMMSDDEHLELDFDPLDDTKVWPEELFEPKPVGRMVLDRIPENFFAESEQIAFGTGVLVDGLDFSDDKMLTGRTFSYSDTQRHRVGANYLQLPVNQPHVRVATNQRDGQMTYQVDTDPDQNTSVDYEPTVTGGLSETQRPPEYDASVGPEVSGRLTRSPIERTNDYKQAGQRFDLQQDWEKEELISNLVDTLSQCDRPIQERMVWHFYMADDEYGRRVGEGLDISLDDIKDMKPLSTQTLTEDEEQRLGNLGHNGPRNIEGLTMTHCVPNDRTTMDSSDPA